MLGVVDGFFFGSLMLLFLLAVFIRLRHAHFQSPFRKDKYVGPSYWGVYSEEMAQLPDEQKTIKLHPVCAPINATAGSSRYASGGAVKSARG